MTDNITRVQSSIPDATSSSYEGQVVPESGRGWKKYRVNERGVQLVYSSTENLDIEVAWIWIWGVVATNTYLVSSIDFSLVVLWRWRSCCVYQ